MKILNSKILYGALICSLLFVGSVSAQEESISPTAVIQNVSVSDSGDDQALEITANRPLTYTFYKTSDPARATIDLSQTDPGLVSPLIPINKGRIKTVTLSKSTIGSSTLTRIEINLSEDAELSISPDAADKGRLVVRLFKPENVRVSDLKSSPEVVAPVATAAAHSSGKEDEKGSSAKGTDITIAAYAQQPADTKTPDVKSAESTTGAPQEINSSTIVVTAITASETGFEIVTNKPVEEYRVLKLTNPERVSIDINSAKSGLATKVVPLNASTVSNARIGIYPDKLRIVLDTTAAKFPQYQVVKIENGLKVLVSKAAESPAETVKNAPSDERQATTVSQPVEETKKIEAAAVQSVEYNQLEDVSRVAVKFSGACSASEPVKGPYGISFSLKNCQLPKNLQRTLEPKAFKGNIAKVTVYSVKTKTGNDAKFVVKLKDEAPYYLTSFAGGINFDVKNPVGATASETIEQQLSAAEKPVAAAGETKESTEIQNPNKKVYTGRRVTLEFSDADVRKIFQLIAEVSNLNFLIGDDVSGTISIKLVNVPWDQALDVILEAKGLAMIKDGNIVQIKPKAKMQNMADEEMAAKKARERVMELKSEVFDVNFASVTDVVTQFNALKSERGTISSDARTNKVIVKDIQSALDEMRFLVKALDTPEQQVMIEARIVEASTDFSRDIGVSWGVAYTSTKLGITDAYTTAGGTLTSYGDPKAPFADSSKTFSSGLSSAMLFGRLGPNIRLDSRLAAASSIGIVKIVSTPKVMTLNNKAAKISQGQSIPYQTTSAEGTKTEFVEAALTLEVTPHVTPDGTIMMKIKATNNSPGTGTPPPINKKEATTELLVKNGETTVIGGIYIDTDTDESNGVPFLMDIPLIGHLFKSNLKKKNKTELLIFITPRIVS